jgi:hypothetical protein
MQSSNCNNERYAIRIALKLLRHFRAHNAYAVFGHGRLHSEGSLSVASHITNEQVSCNYMKNIDPERHALLTRGRAVAKAILTSMQTFLEAGGRKTNEIQVRFDELPGILNKYETAQDELECFDDR